MVKRLMPIISVAILSFVFGTFVWGQMQTPGGSAHPDNKSTDGSNHRANGEQSDKTIQMTDIHDIKPPVRPGFDPAVLYFPLAVILILITVAAAIWLWKKRKKGKAPAFPAPLPSDEKAYRLLDELRGARDISAKEFYFRLSAIFRDYIQGRFRINAPEMTTEEFVPKIDELSIDSELQRKLKALCHFSDPVKFAATPVPESKMVDDLGFIRNFVKQTAYVEADAGGELSTDSKGDRSIGE